MACFAEKSQQVHLCGAHHENGRRGARDRLRCDSRSPGKRLAVAATPIRARGFRGVAGCAKIDKIKKVRPVLVTGVTAPPSQIQPPSPLIFASSNTQGGRYYMPPRKNRGKGTGVSAARLKRAKQAEYTARSRANAPDAAAASSPDPDSDEEAPADAASPSPAPVGRKRRRGFGDVGKTPAKRRCIEANGAPPPPPLRAVTPGWLWVFWGPRVPSAGGGEFRKLKKKKKKKIRPRSRPRIGRRLMPPLCRRPRPGPCAAGNPRCTTPTLCPWPRGVCRCRSRRSRHGCGWRGQRSGLPCYGAQAPDYRCCRCEPRSPPGKRGANCPLFGAAQPGHCRRCRR